MVIAYYLPDRALSSICGCYTGLIVITDSRAHICVHCACLCHHPMWYHKSIILYTCLSSTFISAWGFNSALFRSIDVIWLVRLHRLGFRLKVQSFRYIAFFLVCLFYQNIQRWIHIAFLQSAALTLTYVAVSWLLQLQVRQKEEEKKNSNKTHNGIKAAVKTQFENKINPKQRGELRKNKTHLKKVKKQKKGN